MRFTGILTLLFLLPFSAAAGTFIETFDGKDMEEWRELVQLNKVPGLWETVNGELEVVNRETSLYFLITGDETWEDYTVEFDVKPTKKHGIGGIAVAARVNGSSVVYCSVRDVVVLFDNIIVTGDSIPNKGRRLSVTSRGKLATTWGNLKRF
ncbi:MAG: hypothetical protein OXN25_23135 [Candidatus Poribacteria bacterium]|nr:hypothetical protein [Candidatus Poribacteria bacterium]